ncbi:MAG TPA: lipoate--protein ligase family protein [candidate division Zixibacteria bacterium]|nr:lipoate--protein ligase family protein [candidate division Zixibacteria bacterium]
MEYLDLSFSDPARNLACDEALIEWCEADASRCGVLRLWEAPSYFVVLGHSSRMSADVDAEACARRGVPILRRVSGGGTVLQGPGCLNYALVLSYAADGSLATIGDAFRFVLRRHAELFERLAGTRVAVQGTSDLTAHGRKFSGNAQYRKRRCALIHGTFLLDLDVEMVEACLRMPSRRPPYRGDRDHRSFLGNLGLPAAEVREGLKRLWDAREPLIAVPYARIDELAERRYRQHAWSFKY